MTEKLKTRPCRGTSRASEKISLGTKRSEDTKPLHYLQADFVSRRFGLAPARAELVASLAFSVAEGARQ